MKQSGAFFMAKKKYYHITDFINVESILSTGIKPNYKDVESPFMMGSTKVDKHVDYTLRTEVQDVVFICADPVFSIMKMGSYVPLWRLAVIEILLDEELVLSPKFAYEFELLHSGTIGPQFITGYKMFIEFENAPREFGDVQY